MFKICIDMATPHQESYTKRKMRRRKKKKKKKKKKKTVNIRIPSIHFIPCITSLLPMRITRLPHLPRKTRRRHNRLLILLHLPRTGLVLQRRMMIPCWTLQLAVLNFPLTRLALFLRGQDPAGSNMVARGVVLVSVVVDVGLQWGQ